MGICFNKSSAVKEKPEAWEKPTASTMDETMMSMSIAPGEEILYSKDININHFEINKVVGWGSFGKVFMVTKWDSGEIFAMKVLRKERIKTQN